MEQEPAVDAVDHGLFFGGNRAWLERVKERRVAPSLTSELIARRTDDGNDDNDDSASRAGTKVLEFALSLGLIQRRACNVLQADQV